MSLRRPRRQTYLRDFRRSSPRGTPKAVYVTMLCSGIAIVVAAYSLWSPGLDVRDGRFDLKSNGIWLQHGWLGSDDWFRRSGKADRIHQFRTDSAIRELSTTLQKHHIIDVFPHLCPTDPTGRIPAVDHSQTLRFLRHFDNFRVMPWVGGVLGTHVFLSDPQWRHAFVESICSLLRTYPSLRGVHVNIEPCPSGDGNFLDLLRMLRASLPENRIISVAAFPPPIGILPFRETSWDRGYFESVARHADQMVVMMYDTSVPSQKLYRYLVESWTGDVLQWSGKTRVLIGLPAYEDRGSGYHRPEVENLQNALAGLNAGLERYRLLPGNYQGIAVYSEWEMDDSKWKCLADRFLSRGAEAQLRWLGGDKAMKKSAGVLLYRVTGPVTQVLLVHSNGREVIEPWSIPKGEFDPDHELAPHAAVRELKEEIGIEVPEKDLVSLGDSTYRNKKKRVFGFAWEARCEPVVELQEKEVRLARWMTVAEARSRLHRDHVVFLDRLVKRLESSFEG